MRVILIRAGLPEPIIGHTVYHDGYFVGTPDLAYPHLRLAIEYEGDGHRTSRRVFEDDLVRKELFEAAGWRVVRVSAKRLRDAAHFAAHMRYVYAERSAAVR